MKNFRDLSNALRFLSIDAVQKANSGHPGMPMGMADIAEVLWREFLKHNPANPKWQNRDRFVLSNGHGSMLLYSLLHLSGYDVSIEDLKQFRQLNSRTPGHPEYGCLPGIETTTGPLGQGLATAVGMAMAEKVLAAQFNRPNHEIVDNHTYVFCGDGCLMEGISHEAASLAGVHKLGKLIVFWDDNGISIDGEVKGWFADNTRERFEAYGWHVEIDVDGHDREKVKKAITEARFQNDRPSLICCKTHIAFGAPNLHDTAKSHGAPLGAEEVAATRKNLHWKHEPFFIPEDIYAVWNMKPKGEKLEKHWQEIFAEYKKEYPKLAKEFLRRTSEELPYDWKEKSSYYIKETFKNKEASATRKASQNCLNAYGEILPELFGGSADLTESNLTNWSGSKDITDKSFDGNYIHYGVREFAMFAMMNGISLYGGFVPYGGTFLVFSDYGRSAIRLSAMLEKRVIYVFTHDSIGLGEDGPTHQPIEHLNILRMTPNINVWRPADETETAIAWKSAIESKNKPTCLILTRQKTSMQHTEKKIKNIERGGYILFDSKEIPEGIIIATGSEVGVAIEAAKILTEQGHKIRVVSMPCVELFEKQSAEYKESVLPKNILNRVIIEAGSTAFWYKYAGSKGKVIGIDEFGKSAPAKELFAHFKITAQNIIENLGFGI